MTQIEPAQQLHLIIPQFSQKHRLRLLLTKIPQHSLVNLLELRKYASVQTRIHVVQQVTEKNFLMAATNPLENGRRTQQHHHLQTQQLAQSLEKLLVLDLQLNNELECSDKKI